MARTAQTISAGVEPVEEVCAAFEMDAIDFLTPKIHNESQAPKSSVIERSRSFFFPRGSLKNRSIMMNIAYPRAVIIHWILQP